MRFLYLNVILFVIVHSAEVGQKPVHRRVHLHRRLRPKISRRARVQKCPLMWSEEWTLLMGKKLRTIFDDSADTKFVKSSDVCIPVLRKPVCATEKNFRRVEINYDKNF